MSSARPTILPQPGHPPEADPALPPDADPHAPHRRWLARPRSFGQGLLYSVFVHLGIALVVVAIWELIPGPPPRPIRITTYRNSPTRQDLGILPDGTLPADWATRK
ncbi:MAG TPA: hypothetical protein VMV18_05795 [bacterium]|nr:hypothetical protein [bacterium]